MYECVLNWIELFNADSGIEETFPHLFEQDTNSHLIAPSAPGGVTSDSIFAGEIAGEATSIFNEDGSPPSIYADTLVLDSEDIGHLEADGSCIVDSFQFIGGHRPQAKEIDYGAIARKTKDKKENKDSERILTCHPNGMWNISIMYF